jgi:hypothetical protein
MAAVVDDCRSLLYAPESLRRDTQFILAAVKANPLCFEYVPISLQCSKVVVIAAIREYAPAFQYAPDSLRGDRQFVLSLLNVNQATFLFAHVSLRYNKEFVLLAVRQNASVILHVSLPIRYDKDVVLAAMNSDPNFPLWHDTPVAGMGSNADANTDVDENPPAEPDSQTQKRKRKRTVSGAQKRAKKAADEEDGGYTDKGRMHFKEGGGILITGRTGIRSCLPDSISVLLSSFSISVDPEELRSIMPDDPTRNTLFSDADSYLEKHGLTLQRCTARFMVTGVKGGPQLALLRTKGLFVVQLRITSGKEDKEPDLHCVAYDGETVRDNYKYSKVKELDRSDSEASGAARKVFDSLFKPGLYVSIKNIYELKRKDT